MPPISLPRKLLTLKETPDRAAGHTMPMFRTGKTQQTNRALSVFDEWHKNPDYVRELKDLKDEYKLANQLIKAKGKAKPTQEELAYESVLVGKWIFISHTYQDARALESLHACLSQLR